MRYALLLLVLVACSSSTDLKAGDPSILVTNDLPSSWVYVTWKDGQGTVGQDSVAARTTKCVRFTAQPDSAAWTITASQTYPEFAETVTSAYTAPWFNPSDHPAWQINVTPGTQGGSPTIQALDVSSAC